MTEVSNITVNGTDTTEQVRNMTMKDKFKQLTVEPGTQTVMTSTIRLMSSRMTKLITKLQN